MLSRMLYSVSLIRHGKDVAVVTRFVCIFSVLVMTFAAGCRDAAGPVAVETEIDVRRLETPSEYGVNIDAYLLEEGERRLIASPRLVVVPGQKASIFEGDLAESCNAEVLILKDGGRHRCDVEITLRVNGEDLLVSRQGMAVD
jgi:hypothetical protein